MCRNTLNFPFVLCLKRTCDIKIHFYIFSSYFKLPSSVLVPIQCQCYMNTDVEIWLTVDLAKSLLSKLVVFLEFFFNVPVNNFSVMLEQSHRFLDIYQYFGEVSCPRTLQRPWGSNPGPLAPESDTLPLGHRAPLLSDWLGMTLIVLSDLLVLLRFDT